MITRDMVRGFFRHNQRRGVSLDREMLWGYFFTDPDPRSLEAAYPALERAGYEFVDVLEPGEDDDNPQFWLHVEKVEQHSASSLYQRCVELYRFAEEHSLGTFDGFDVGNVDGSNLIDF